MIAATINIDFETYSECDLLRSGAFRYSQDPSTEAMCMAYAFNGGEPKLWKNGEPFPAEIGAALDAGAILNAWNSQFEYVIWHNCLHWREVPLQQWHDTATQAATHAMPRALGPCGEAMRFDQDAKKSKRGKFLIQRLCKPYRGKRITDPSLMAEMYEYCLQDVVAEMAIGAALPPLDAGERAVWQLDQTINIRGVHFDIENVNHAAEIADQAAEILRQQLEDVTGGELTNPKQVAKTTIYLNERHGVKLDSLAKASVNEALASDLPTVARQVLEIRQSAGKTSVSKYPALQNIVCEDNRGHGLLMYHGAATGRWSGRLFQPQNLARGSMKFADILRAVKLFKHRDAGLIEALFGCPMEVLSSCVRSMICAPKGRKLLVADYSAIEARVLPWLSGQRDVLRVFKGDGKIYEHTAAQIYGISIDEVTKEQRFIGKVATLALGYAGGKKAFVNMAFNYGVDIDEALADRIKVDWREANPRTVGFWYSCERAAIDAVENPGTMFKVEGIPQRVQFKVVGDFLYCRLPSGRKLAYYQPEMKTKPTQWGEKECVTFMGTNSYTRKWERQDTYGGKLVENICQAVARDIMAGAMLSCERQGYEIVLTVHDEIVCEVDEVFGSVDELEKIMCELPTWAEGLPLAAEGFEAQRYKK